MVRDGGVGRDGDVRDVVVRGRVSWYEKRTGKKEDRRRGGLFSRPVSQYDN